MSVISAVGFAHGGLAHGGLAHGAPPLVEVGVPRDEEGTRGSARARDALSAERARNVFSLHAERGGRDETLINEFDETLIDDAGVGGAEPGGAPGAPIEEFTRGPAEDIEPGGAIAAWPAGEPGTPIEMSALEPDEIEPGRAIRSRLVTQ